MYLVGAIHTDPKGPERLTKLLRYLKPKSVGIEWVMADGSVCPSYDDLLKDLDLVDSLIEKQRLLIRKSEFPPVLKDFLIWSNDCYHYEFRVPVKLKKEIGFSLYCVDHPMGRRKIYQEPSIDETWIKLANQDKEKYRAISLEQLQQEFQKFIDETYINPLTIQKIDEYLGSAPGPIFEGKRGIREAYLFEKVKESNPDVQIGGLGHMMENPPEEFEPFMHRYNLAKRLKSAGINVIQVKLVKMDQIISSFKPNF